MSFAEVFKKKCVKGKIAVRRAQFKLAEKSAAMAIFLGKVYLEQDDNTRADIAPAAPVNLVIAPRGDPDESS